MDILDREFLLDNVGGDTELLREIIDLFFESTGEILDSIRAAVTKADNDSLHRSAHQLKGALANVGAKAATDSALELETLGRNGVLSGLEDAMDALDQEMTRLTPELQSLAASAD